MTCGVWDDTDLGFKGQPIVDCRMSVYLPPDNSNCKVEQKNPNTVLVECAVDKIYPNLFCDISQVYMDDNKRNEIPGNDIHYVNNDISGRSSCSATIDLPLRGEYKFWVVLYPDVDPLSRLRKTFMTMSRIQRLQKDGTPYRKLRKDIGELQLPLFVTIETSVATAVLEVLSEEDHSICSKDDNLLRAKCTAKGFNAQPKFEWKVNGLVLETTIVEAVTGFTGVNKAFASTVSTELSKTFHGNELSCIVSPIDDQPVRGDDVKETKTIAVKWPPEEKPTFIGKGIELSDMNLPIGEDIDLLCSVPDGNPKVKNTRVRCWDLEFDTVDSDSRLSSRAVAPSTVDVSLDKSQTSDQLKFNIKANASRRGCRCECSAEHVTGCYAKHAHLEIQFVEDTYEPLVAVVQSRKFVIVVSVCCVMLLVVCTCGVFVCVKKGKHGGEHFYEDPVACLKDDVYISRLQDTPTTKIDQTIRRGESESRRISHPFTDNGPDKRRSRTISYQDHGYGSETELIDCGGYSVPLFDTGFIAHGEEKKHRTEQPETDSDGDSVTDETPYSEVFDFRPILQARIVNKHQDTRRKSIIIQSPMIINERRQSQNGIGVLESQLLAPFLGNVKTERV